MFFLHENVPGPRNTTAQDAGWHQRVCLGKGWLRGPRWLHRLWREGQERSCYSIRDRTALTGRILYHFLPLTPFLYHWCQTITDMDISLIRHMYARLVTYMIVHVDIVYSLKCIRDANKTDRTLVSTFCFFPKLWKERSFVPFMVSGVTLRKPPLSFVADSISNRFCVVEE